MSTADRFRTVVAPPLIAGDRLSRAEFHRRYEASPEDLRAELIDGEVLMASPVSADHGEHAALIVYSLVVFAQSSPALRASENATLVLDDLSEPQPDGLPAIRPEYGGRVRLIDGDDTGAPELVIEIAKATRDIDLGRKRNDYERNGISEYLVVAIEPAELFWFVARHGRFERRSPDADGILRSESFPGFWLDVDAFLRLDSDRLTAVLALGKASPEHKAFIVGLDAARRDDSVN